MPDRGSHSPISSPDGTLHSSPGPESLVGRTRTRAHLARCVKEAETRLWSEQASDWTPGRALWDKVGDQVPVNRG